MTNRYASIDEYIASFPDDARAVLETVRRTAHGAVPDAGEKISYQMPTITRGGRNLVHFAAWKNHLSIYPVPAGDADFERDIAPYLSGKGTARFQFDEPIPYDLIGRLVALLAQTRPVDAKQ
jgi:uncharacterized protein YdhG (YjbR/CyaY superfamily)